MSTIGLLGVTLISLFPYLFVWWKRLREDYVSSQIFSFGFICFAFLLLGAVVGSLIGKRLAITDVFDPRNLWFWSSLLMYGLSVLLLIKKYNFRFFETIEAGVVAVLPVYSIFLYYFAARDASFALALYGLVTLIHIFLFLFLATRYKKFTWYKSGRTGFAGLTTGGFFFLVRSLVAISFPSMVSFIGKSDAIVSGALAFLLFFAVYNLSEA